jgi:altronate dehydratase
MSAAPAIVELGGRDNVVVAVRALAAGETVELSTGEAVTLAEAIPFGHKLATRAIAEGGDVVKYDEVIGRTTAAIPAGAHVHVHNVVSARLPGEMPTYGPRGGSR